MSSERFAGIKLPAQFGQVLILISQIERPATPEVVAAKVEELSDLYEAILSSPDYDAWRQGISPEAYRNPTAYGGTDPRDPFKDYVRLPRATRQDSWIPMGGGPYERMAADGLVYTFKDGSLSRIKNNSSYKVLLAEIEHKLYILTNEHPPYAYFWEGEQLGAGLPADPGPPVLPFEHSTPGTQAQVLVRRPFPPRPTWTTSETVPESQILIPKSLQPRPLPGRISAAKLGARIHKWVDEAYRALESPDKRIYLSNGAYVIANRTIGGKMRPDVFYVDPQKKEFAVIDIYTGSKKDVFTPTGFDSASHAKKGMDYISEPFSNELKRQGYKYRGYFIAHRPASLPPNKLH
jgi:hypothetical protein